MKKLFLLFGLLAACGGTPKEVAKTPAPLPSCADVQIGESCQPSPLAQVASKTIRGVDWSITMLGDGWEKKETPNTPASSSGVLFVNKESNSVLSVFRDQIDPSLKMEIGTFVIGFSKKIESEGGTIDTVDRVWLNDKEYAHIIMRKSVVKLQAWMRLENNVAHVVLCGGLSFERQVETDCNKMANTFQINPTKSHSATPFQGHNDFQGWIAKLASNILNQD